MWKVSDQRPPPRRASFSSGYPSSTLIELKPYGSKNCLANFWIPTWRAPSEGRFRESDPCRRRRVSRLASVALPLLGGPCCRVAALPSRRARECAVITRCAVTTCGPPVPILFRPWPLGFDVLMPSFLKNCLLSFLSPFSFSPCICPPFHPYRVKALALLRVPPKCKVSFVQHVWISGEHVVPCGEVGSMPTLNKIESGTRAASPALMPPRRIEIPL